MITCLRRCSLKFSELETKAGCLTIASLCVSLIISQYINDITVWLKFYCNEHEVKWSESRSVMSDSLRPHVLYSPWNSPGQNTGVGSLSLLQGIFPTQGIEPRSPAFQADSLPAEPPGKPYIIAYAKSLQSCPTLCNPMDYRVHRILQARILQWVAFPFSRGSSQPRDLTQVSSTAGEFFTSWATREAQEYWIE